MTTASRGVSDRLPSPAPVGSRTAASLLSPRYATVVAALVAVAATYGLAVQDAYRAVPDLLEQTWRAQDAVTLVTVPLLLVAVQRARAGSLPAHLLAVGVLGWYAYAYAHLAVAAPLNAMFLVYVAVVALAAAGVLDGLLRVDVTAAARAFARAPARPASWFLAVAGLGIAGLWVSDIVSGLAGGTPTGLHLAELPNPTWVLDLAVVIPGAIAAAALLRRGHPAGPVVAAVLLVMLLILSAAMLTVVPFALAAGLGSDPDVAIQLVVFSVVFTVLGAVELWLLLAGRRRLGPLPARWLRTGWWSEQSGE